MASKILSFRVMQITCVISEYVATWWGQFVVHSLMISDSVFFLYKNLT